MFAWFAENWIICTAGAVGFYALVSLIEFFVGSKNHKTHDLSDRIKKEPAISEEV